jgi:hypothetical protein
MKIWINGHEWAKRQAAKTGIGFTELSNGFATATDPAGLQAICDRLGPGAITVFAERWWSILPLPLNEHDRAAGYWWELSMRQVETSRTLVFDAPRHARGFFEALVVDNLDIGRPELIELIFKRGQHRGAKAGGQYKTKIVTYGTEVNVTAFYRHSRIKQYLKDGRALRIETVINDAYDLGCKRRLVHLDELQSRARTVNTALLDTERVGQGCVLASPAFERIAQPTLTEDGRRAPALRFGDPRVQALAGALCTSVLAVTGITNKSLRALMTRPARRDDLHQKPGQLRPGSATRQRAYRPHPEQESLPAHQRRPAVCDLLHQTPRPPATTPTRHRPATHPAAVAKGVAHHRHSHHKKPSTRPDSCRTQPKTQDNCQHISDQGPLARNLTLVLEGNIPRFPWTRLCPPPQAK